MAFNECMLMHQKCLSICGYRVHSLKWLSTESDIFGFRLNSNMLTISFAMGMLSYQN